VKVLISLLSSAANKQIRAMRRKYPYLRYRTRCYYGIIINYQLLTIIITIIRIIIINYSACLLFASQ